MKQEQPLGSLSICLSSVWRAGMLIWSKRSTGFLPCLSLELREAPLISKERTGLVERRDSTDFTARCRGVKPSMSCSFRS
jgi:hypothetical protein